MPLEGRSLATQDIEPPATGRRRRDVGSLVVKRSSRHGGFEVVSGHQAYFRAARARVERVLCLERIDVPDQDPLERLAELNAFGGLDPIEEAEILLDAMRRHDVNQHGVAALTGYTQPHVSKRLKLLHLTPRDRSLLIDGRITLDEALDILRGGAPRRRDAGLRRGPRRATT